MRRILMLTVAALALVPWSVAQNTTQNPAADTPGEKNLPDSVNIVGTPNANPTNVSHGVVPNRASHHWPPSPGRTISKARTTIRTTHSIATVIGGLDSGVEGTGSSRRGTAIACRPACNR